MGVIGRVLAFGRADAPVFVGKSKIDGFGVFARYGIGKGDYIGTLGGLATDADDEHVLWFGDTGLAVEGTLRYLNHAPEPNAELRGTDLYAVRSIEKGEEVTIHYGSDWDDD